MRPLYLFFGHYTVIGRNFLTGDPAVRISRRRSVFRRCFKKYYAQSPMNYVALYRLKYAQELLLKSSLSISEIAAECGFRDSSYFVKVFRKYLGQTPSEYRKASLA